RYKQCRALVDAILQRGGGNKGVELQSACFRTNLLRHASQNWPVLRFIHQSCICEESMHCRDYCRCFRARTECLVISAKFLRGQAYQASDGATFGIECTENRGGSHVPNPFESNH
ncbi:hypothetical protein CPB85DRAFT_1354547, partial [Mucidula mucida]